MTHATTTLGVNTDMEQTVLAATFAAWALLTLVAHVYAFRALRHRTRKVSVLLGIFAPRSAYTDVGWRERNMALLFLIVGLMVLMAGLGAWQML